MTRSLAQSRWRLDVSKWTKHPQLWAHAKPSDPNTIPKTTSSKPSPSCSSCRSRQCGTGRRGILRGRLSQVLGLTVMKRGTTGCRSNPSCWAQLVPALLRSPWSPRGRFLSAPGTGQTQSRRGCTPPGTRCPLRVPTSTPSLAPAPQRRGPRPHQGQLCHPLFLEELIFLPHL